MVVVGLTLAIGFTVPLGFVPHLSRECKTGRFSGLLVLRMPCSILFEDEPEKSDPALSVGFCSTLDDDSAELVGDSE